MSQLGFWAFAQSAPNAPALIDPQGRRFNRGELLAACNQLAHGLRARGLKRGDAIAICAPNAVEFFELYLAATQIGLYLVPVNWHLAVPEIAHILGDSSAKLFIADQRVGDTARQAALQAGLDPQQLFALGDIDGFSPYSDLLEGQPAELPPDRKAGQVMNYTSGTTGKPKAVQRPLPDMSPDDLYSIMPSMMSGTFGIVPEQDNVHYCGSPLYHTAVVHWSGNSLHLGHCVALVDKWDGEQMLADIERYRVTTTHMVPTQFTRLLKLPEEVRKRYDYSSLRQVIHAAAPCPPDIKRAMLDWWGPVIYEYYAGTEGGSAICTPEDWLRFPGTVGKAPPSSGVRILDDAGNDLPPNTTGTVYLKVMDGMDFEYRGDKEKTRKNRIGDYFTLGDVGHLNEEGFLFLSDRKIDMIISGGANIYPAEVENALILHPKVADCAVFGIPNEEWGEEVKAVVQPLEGVSANGALAEAILEFLSERVARMKLPRSIDFVAELPRDPNGKLYKRRLRDPYWQGRARNV